MFEESPSSNSSKSYQTSDSQISQEDKYIHQNIFVEQMFQFNTQSIEDNHYTMIGIITGKRSRNSRVQVLGNGSLISKSLGLTILNSISYIKDYQLHQYHQLAFHPFPHGKWKRQQRYRISRVSYPIQKIIQCYEKDCQQNESLVIFRLQQKVKCQRDFLKPTVFKCRTCLFGKNQKSLRLCGYSFKQDSNETCYECQNVALFGLEKNGRVESISPQNKLLYFKILASKIQRGCPLFADNQYIGIYLKSRYGTSIGLLFTQQMIQNMRLFEQGIDGAAFQIQGWLLCNHSHLISTESNQYLEQLKDIQCIDNSGKGLSIVYNLQYFLKLKYLYLSNNNIEAIDLTKINNRLEQLNLSHNNIQTITVSFLTDLLKLNISSNILSSIDVSSNYKLTLLNLSNNSIHEKINVANNTQLLLLDISCNYILRQISLSNNKKFIILSLEHNDIYKIDLAGNTQLEKLDISHNNLKEINLNNNTKLLTLFLNNNQLYQINLMNNTKLQKINLQYNNLQKQICLPHRDLYKISLKNNKQLRQVDIHSQKLKQMHLSKSNFTQTPVNLTKVNQTDKLSLHETGRYSNRHISPQNCEVNGFQQYQRPYKIRYRSMDLRTVSIQNMGLEYRDVGKLRLIKKLDISGNKIYKIDLSSNRQLVHLSISNNILENLNLEFNKKLIILQASQNLLKKINLVQNKQLKYINLSENILYYIDLTYNTKIQTLILNDNNLMEINTSNNPLLTKIIFNPHKIRSIIISYNRELLQNFKSINPLTLQQNGVPHTKQAHEKMDFCQDGRKNIDFLIKIVIVCRSYEEEQCKNYIQQLNKLRYICFFEQQSEDPILFDQSPTYNNVIFQLQVKQTNV